MEAIVLVGGQGTRLRPLTVSTPKPMLPVAGEPFLTHQLRRLATVGVEHVVLATSYRAEAFAAHFGDGTQLGLRLDYVTETEPLGTGGGLRNVASLLSGGPDEPVFALNGDVLSGHDMAAQLSLHQRSAAAVTLHLVRVPDARAFGSVPTSTYGRVTAFLEKTPDPVTDQINAGCYLLRRRVLDAIAPGVVVSVERDTFPALLAAGETVMGYLDESYWLDVGTPAAFVQANVDLVTGRAGGVPAAEGGQALLHPSARIDPAATVGGGSSIGPDAVIDAGAEVVGSVLLAGARIGADARVVASVVGEQAVVGPGCELNGVVIGDTARLGARNELRDGARVWPQVVLPDVGVRFSTDV